MQLQTKIYNFFQDIEQNKNLSMISLTIANKDSILFDFKKEPYLKDDLQLVFSITKSITSLAIGMLFDQGLIDLNEPIIKYFKNELPTTYDPLIKEITIKHLLTMTTGVVKENNLEMLKTNDFRTYFLSQEVVYKPGSHFQYHSATSHMLSALFTKITGQTVETYLDYHLFKPLDIMNYHWSNAHEGISFGGYGLSLNNSALIKIGQLLLNHGVYNKKRYISEAYLKLATSPQSIKQDNISNPNAKAIGYQYGFQFHVSPNQSYRADGAFGQVIVIFNELAIVSTAQSTDYDYLYSMIYKHFTNEEVKLIDDQLLEDYLLTQTFKQLPKENTLNIVKFYELNDNELSIKSLKFSNEFVVFTYNDGSSDKIDYNFKQNNYGQSLYAKDLNVVKQKHWVLPKYENNTLLLNILYVETPFFAEYLFDFNFDKLNFTFKPSTNFLLNEFVVKSK